jgi:hypothetical protein
MDDFFLVEMRQIENIIQKKKKQKLLHLMMFVIPL